MSDARERRAIGRPRSIDRGKIVAAATEIGIDRLTMRAVAEQLGVTTQALYNHIGGRSELLALLSTDSGGAFDLADDESLGWQELLGSFARTLRRGLLARPGASVAFSTRGPTTVGAVRFLDRIMTEMRAAGFGEAEALLAFRSVLALVVTSVQRQENEPGSADHEAAQRNLFHQALGDAAADDLPNLAFIAASWSTDDPDRLFEYTVSCLVAGIEAQRGWPDRTPTGPSG